MRETWTRLLTLLPLILLLVGAVLPARPAEARPPARQDVGQSHLDEGDVEAFFDELVPRQLEEHHIVGATVAVVADGELLFARGYGYANRERQVAVVADRTLFYIGSAGKLFTWTAVMQLAEQGTLDLHADVNTYLDVPIPATFPEPITMAHLMTHTPGFEEQLAALQIEPRDLLPLRDFLIRSLPRRVYPPGRTFAYSNYGTAMAGYVVERVSGQSYEQYVTRQLLEPLGMERSAAVQPLPPPLAAELSKGFRWRTRTYDAVDFEWIAAAPEGPVRATASDVARFMIAHLENGRYRGARILGEATVREMHARQFAHDPRLPGMAYGFVASRENDRNVLWHDGESARFKTILALLPEQRAGLLVSYNTPGIDPRATLSAFLDRFYPPAEAPAPGRAADFGIRVEQLGGTFVPARSAHSSNQKLVTRIGAIDVGADPDESLRVDGERYVEIEPGLFRQAEGERRVAFGRNAKGQVTQLFRGPIAYFRVPWYEALLVQLLVPAISLTLLLSALLAWPFAFLVRRWRRWPALPGPRPARPLAATLGLLSIALCAAWLVLMARYVETYIYPVAAMNVLTRLTWLVAFLAPAVVALAVLAWKERAWNLAWRIHYTLVALGASAFVLWLSSWNLLAGGS